MRCTLLSVRIHLLSAAIVLVSLSRADAGHVNFETLPGGAHPAEGLHIGSAYLASQGMSFSVEGGADPMLVERGAPIRTGFQGVGGSGIDPGGFDQHAAGQGVGNYYINNNNLVVREIPLPFVVTYAQSMGIVSGVILDIDNDNESWRAEALGSGGVVLDSLEFGWNSSSDVGDGVATDWSFTRSENDIVAVRFVYTGTTAHDIGYAFDNFRSAFAAPEPPTLTMLGTALMTVVIPAWRHRRKAGKH